MFRPKATQVLSPADREVIEKNGVAVVECSWARLADVPFGKIASPYERLRTYFDPIRAQRPQTASYSAVLLQSRTWSLQILSTMASHGD